MTFSSKIILGAVLAVAAFATQARADYTIYCQGRLGDVVGEMPFKWSPYGGAGAHLPGRGECAWPDRGPRGDELIATFIRNAPATRVAAGNYVKFCVKGIQHTPYGLEYTGGFSTVSASDIDSDPQPC